METLQINKKRHQICINLRIFYKCGPYKIVLARMVTDTSGHQHERSLTRVVTDTSGHQKVFLKKEQFGANKRLIVD